MLDRKYNLCRMGNHGINLDDHPEYRTYQTFYEMGIAPPTHEEMADIIIGRAGRQKKTDKGKFKIPRESGAPRGPQNEPSASQPLQGEKMNSEQCKLSLCQFLAEQPIPSLKMLLRKHELVAQGYDLESITEIVLDATSAQIQSLISEILRTRQTLRYDIKPHYRFDERWKVLERSLFLDGYKIEAEQLVPVDPTIEGSEPLDDDLTKAIKKSSLPKANEINTMLDNSTAAFKKEPPDINACLSDARVALETTAASIAEKWNQSHPQTNDSSKWGQVLAFLRNTNLITEKEEKGLAGVYGFVSPGAHQPIGLENIEMARLGRSLTVGMIYFLITRFVEKDQLNL